MFVRQLNKRFYSLFSGYREKEHGVFTAENAAKFLVDARLVRCKDYVFYLSSSHHATTLTTTSNWFFVLTNAAVYFPFKNVREFPKTEIEFLDSVCTSPFGAPVEYDPGVPSPLVFAREGLGRFEEYKNLFYVLGDHINLRVKAHPVDSEPFMGAVLLSGVEVNLEGA